MDEPDLGEDGVDAVGLGCSLERFTEWKEVVGLIDELTDKPDSEFRTAENSYFRFKYIVNQYIEQPHLLDPYLEEILAKIVGVVLNESVSKETKHRAFKFMHLVTNVRGYKRVLQYLPHAAADMAPILLMLEEQDETDKETWETRYCLLLWLSIITKIPFDLSRLDDTTVDPSNTIAQRLLNACKKYLLVGDSCRDSAAYLASQFLTRSDTKVKELPEFFEWASKWIVQKQESWKRSGPQAAVAAILKYGKRQDLLPHADGLLKTMLNMDWKKEPYPLSRKMAVKIIQRLGLTYLKNRAVFWRYKRGARVLPSLSDMISCGNSVEKHVKPEVNGGLGDNRGKDEEDDEEEDQEVPQELDDVIEELMQGLRDRYVIVRWSSAKGIGRVIGRLNKQFGDDVLGYILDLLTPRETADAWHGGCLALAECSKHGLLLPSRLDSVIPLVKRALVYDEPLGYTSVGTHIRDAACYVCWTFARAYESAVFKPYVQDIASSLVVVFCLDREVNVRRAAAAAFQEHIGRQGTFPHGIEILTTADYYSVGVRNNSYLNICPFVAQFEEYTTALIDHLVDRKLEHWDSAVRDLAAKALHNLTTHAPLYMSEIVLPQLLQKVKSIDPNVRHGSITSIGEVSHALSLIPIDINDNIVNAIGDIVKDLKLKHQFKGVNGELMKIACCRMIQKCSLAKLPYRGLPVVDEWQELLNECLCHEVANIRSAAAEALPAVCSQYYRSDEDGTTRRNDAKTSQLINDYTSKLSANDNITRVGHALALGALPSFMLEGYVDHVVNCLMKCCKITHGTEKWVDSRRFAIKALTSVCTTIGAENKDDKNSFRTHALDVVHCMVQSMGDYTKDDRGDTGAWVRESSMSGLQQVLHLIASTEKDILTPVIMASVMPKIAQQAVERIDRTRALAGTVFASLLHSVPPVPHVPERDELLTIFTEDECKHSINWLSHADTFPRFTQLLRLQPYAKTVLLGLIASVGGVTESLVKTSSQCFFDFLKKEGLKQVRQICDLIVEIFEEECKTERLIVPILNFLNLFLAAGVTDQVLLDSNSTFPLRVLDLTKLAVGSSTDKFKLLSSVDVYCQLVQVKGEISKKALGRLQLLLCHRFGWLRKATATKLYETLMVYEEALCLDDGDHLDRALSVLSDTEWSLVSVEEARISRNQISESLGIRPPMLIAKSSPAVTVSPTSPSTS